MGETDTSVPVDEGETYQLDIINSGSKGDGIAKKDGYVIFVPGTSPGDRVIARIDRTSRQFAYAELVETIEEAGDEER